jgi:hypothetical protein
MAFDPKCYDLAEHFLAGESPPVSKAKVAQLAQVIDDAIHDWIEFLHDARDSEYPQ